MNGFSGKLDQIETKLQSFIEGKLSRLSAIRGGSDEVSRQLVSAMQAGTISSDEGMQLAPDQFTLLAHPSQANLLRDDPEMLVDLANLIREIGGAAGYHFGQHPVITISPNEDVPTDRIDIIARISANAMGHTATLNSAVLRDIEAVHPTAFLIVNGMDIFPLDKTVINIGRHSNNNLTIDENKTAGSLVGRLSSVDPNATASAFLVKAVHQKLKPVGAVCGARYFSPNPNLVHGYAAMLVLYPTASASDALDDD